MKNQLETFLESIEGNEVREGVLGKGADEKKVKVIMGIFKKNMLKGIEAIHDGVKSNQIDIKTLEALIDDFLWHNHPNDNTP